MIPMLRKGRNLSQGIYETSGPSNPLYSRPTHSFVPFPAGIPKIITFFASYLRDPTHLLLSEEKADQNRPAAKLQH